MVSTLLPLLLSTAYFGGDLDAPRQLSPSRLLDQNFGLSLTPEQLLLSRYYVLPPGSLLRDRVGSSLLDYHRPWGELLRQQDQNQRRGVSRVKYDSDAFRVHLDVQQFKPEEIEVSVDEERRHLVIKAKHEEKKDEHGLISRQFVRRYGLPENVLVEQIASEISSDGVLTVSAPLKPEEKDKPKDTVRRIKIEYTGKPALKQQTEEKKQTENDDDEISITTVEPEIGSGASTTTADSASSTTSEEKH